MTENNPYLNLPDFAYWKKCREDADFLLDALYQPKFTITPEMGIATAGSCFAQHIARYLMGSNANYLNVEPAPKYMQNEDRKLYNYDLYSARYGNIYTPRHLRQLLEEAFQLKDHKTIIWPKDGGFIDAMRPTLEPLPFSTKEELIHFRKAHVCRVRELFKKTDVFFFTLSLTESWRDKNTGRVFPTFPGVFPNVYDEDIHEFYNAPYEEAKADMEEVIAILKAHNPNIKILLSVSPAGLIASNTGQHVLKSTVDAKCKLRSIAGILSETDEDVDYFPCYELVTSHIYDVPFYDEGRRHVSPVGISLLMTLFFLAHGELISKLPLTWVNELEEDNSKTTQDTKYDELINEPEDSAEAAVCQEVLLEAFT